jgi:hypothetical protein
MAHRLVTVGQGGLPDLDEAQAGVEMRRTTTTRST